MNIYCLGTESKPVTAEEVKDFENKLASAQKDGTPVVVNYQVVVVQAPVPENHGSYQKLNLAMALHAQNIFTDSEVRKMAEEVFK